MSILSKLQSLLSAANTKTGASDTTLTDAVSTLIDGYGQGSDPVIQPLSVTENGTYTVEEGIDGFNPVVVDVPNPSTGSISITENGTYDVTDYAEVDVKTVYKPKAIRFIDYDGEIIEEWTLEELAIKDSLPTPPTHERLIFDGWNWSLADLKARNKPMDVGAYYDTTSGLTEFDVKITSGTLLLNLKMVGEKDWGDGTKDSLLKHTYAEAGEYLVTCDGTAIPADPSSTHVSGINGASTTNAACAQILHTRLSSKVTSIGNYGFFKQSLMKTISMSKNVTTIGTSAFAYCKRIKFVTIPVITTMPKTMFQYAFCLEHVSIANYSGALLESTFDYCGLLDRLCLPDGITALANYLIREGHSLVEAYLPESITTIGTSDFINCPMLKEIYMPSEVITIAATAFQGCTSLGFIDCRDSAAAITLSAATALDSIDFNGAVVVPDDLYNAWIAKSYWKVQPLKACIIKASEYIKY